MEMDANQRKEYIILITIDLIDEYGIHNVSTKEIAKRLNVSEGLIFKLYPKKSDLFLAVLDRFSLYDKDMFYTAMKKNIDSMEAIRFYFNSYMVYYENYPAITAVYQVYDTLKGDVLLEQKVKEIFLNRLAFVSELVKRAQENGKLKETIDPAEIAIILSSVVRGVCLKWRIMEHSFSLRDKTMDNINLVLNAIKL